MKVNFQNDKNQLHFMNILNSFNNEKDIKKIILYLENFEKNALNGDSSAQMIMNIMVNFSRLIDIAKNKD